jgi:hypothetical protein
MNIYFSPVPEEFTAGDNFTFQGKEYYYMLQINRDDVVIADTAGRTVPIDHESLFALYSAIKTAECFLEQAVVAEQDIARAEQYLEKLFA